VEDSYLYSYLKDVIFGFNVSFKASFKVDC
jgi:hypothetical protein